MNNCCTVNVRDFGALGDGIRDDAPAIQAALDSLREKGGVVLLPPGLYRMCAGAVVPLGVNVTGVTTAATGPWQNHLDTRDKGFPGSKGGALRGTGDQWIDPGLFQGTWVLSEHGRGDADGAATFRLEGGTSIRKIGFVSRFLPPVSDSFVPCPPHIALISENTLPNTREGVTVEDISLANCYTGIVFSVGDKLEDNYPALNGPNDLSKSCGRHRIHHIMGGPLYRGVVLKGMLDTVDVSNCQFNYSCYETTYCRARTEHAADLFLSRGDGICISNCLSYGAYHGLKTEASFKNNNGTCSFRLSNSNFEGIVPLALHSGGLYEISNCYFLTTHPLGVHPDTLSACLQIVQPESCVHNPFIAVGNCVFQNGVSSRDCGRSVALDIRLRCGAFPVVSACQFWGWGGDDPVVRFQKSEKPAGALTLSSCVFTGSGGVDTPPSRTPAALARAGGDGYREGDLLFVNCRIPAALVDAESRRGVWYENCVLYDDEGTNTRFSL